MPDLLIRRSLHNSAGRSSRPSLAATAHDRPCLGTPEGTSILRRSVTRTHRVRCLPGVLGDRYSLGV
jgi:hypothetical protein